MYVFDYLHSKPCKNLFFFQSENFFTVLGQASFVKKNSLLHFLIFYFSLEPPNTISILIQF